MKYLALLRDSFREALDSKVIYFTFGLSFLLVFILLSVSYRPVTVKEEAELFCSQMNLAWSLEASGRINKEPARGEVIEFEQTNEAANPWEGDYRFVVALDFPADTRTTPEGKGKIIQVQFGLRNYLNWLKNLTVTETVKEDQVLLHFTSQGTKIKNLSEWRHEASLFFGALPLSWFRSSLTQSVFFIQNYLVNNIGAWVIILIGVIITAFFIPNMLQKGSVDLLLVKPITRVELLLFKYLGGLSFVLVNSAVAIGGVWLALGLRTGIWTYGFPLTILLITFFFAILYAVSTLFGVLTRSAVLCIFMTCLVWFGLFALGQAHAALNTNLPGVRPMQAGQDSLEERRETMADTDPTLRQIANVINVLHAILPRTQELGQLTARLVSAELLSEEERRLSGFNAGPDLKWQESLGVSLAFIAVILGLACWRFAVRDY